MIVAQATGPLLDVGLQQKERVAELLLAKAHELALLESEGQRIGQQLAADPVGEDVKELAIAAQEARGQDRRPHGHVLAAELDRLLQGAGRAADPEPRVPEPVLEPLRDEAQVGRQLLAVQDEQIDVGMDRHLPPREAADGDRADALLEDSAPGNMNALGEVEEPANQAVGEIGVRLVHPAPGARAAVQGGQIPAYLREIATHRRHDRRLARVGLYREVGQERIDRGCPLH